MKPLSHKQCIKLLKKYKTPYHIFEHSRKVNAVAMFLARKANKKGFNINLKTIDNVSLLHDIEKMNSLINKTNHADEGKKTLAYENQHELAELVGSHIGERFDFSKFSIYPSIIYYADMRVTEDKIVSLKERYKYLKERYGSQSPERMKFYIQTENKLFKLENDLLRKLKIKPEAIRESAVKKYLIKETY